MPTKKTSKKSRRSTVKPVTVTTQIPPTIRVEVTTPVPETQGVILVRDQDHRLMFVTQSWLMPHTIATITRQLMSATIHQDQFQDYWCLTHQVHHWYKNWQNWLPITTHTCLLEAIDLTGLTMSRVNQIQWHLDDQSVSHQIWRRSAQWIQWSRINGDWQREHDTWSEAYVAWVARQTPR